MGSSGQLCRHASSAILAQGRRSLLTVKIFVDCLLLVMFHSCFGPGDVLDLSGHGTWANTDLCEIIHDLVDALSPLQIISKGQEERVAALEAVKKTAQEHTDRKQLRVDAVAMASHT